MSELTLTLLRLGMLALLWIFIFSVVGVLRNDLYGTTVSRRSKRKARKAEQSAAVPAGAILAGGAGAGAAASGAGESKRRARRGRPQIPDSIVVTEGPLAGMTLPLRSSGVLIGRNPECTLVLDDDYASGRHAKISQNGEGWAVEDLASTNGTYLNDEKLTRPQSVDIGSQLRIGKTVIEFRG